MSKWIKIRVKDFYKDAVGELEYTLSLIHICTLHIGTLASNNVNNIVNDTSKYDEYKEKVKELSLIHIYEEGNQVGIGKENGNGGLSITIPNWNSDNRGYTVKVQAKNGSTEIGRAHV